MSTLLSISEAKNLVGKQIKWSSPGYHMNGNYGGVAVITSVVEGRNPIGCEMVSGDELFFAFVEFPVDDILCYSDGGRYITYEIL